MAGHHRERTERHINVRPYYRRQPQQWEPFHDWPTSRVFEHDMGTPLNDYDFELARQRFFREPVLSRQPLSFGMSSVAAHHPPPFTRQLSEGRSLITTDDGKFKISLDIKNFDPEDISVKTVGDMVEVQGRHEEKKDELGIVKRDFTRKYNIPSNVDPLTITSSLSEDGVLTVEAPIRAKAIEQPGPRLLEVKHEKGDGDAKTSTSDGAK